jgi:hypothetical protein
VRVLGTTVLSLIFDSSQADTGEYEAADDLEIGGGSTHNFERSIEYYEPAEDDRRFGFNVPG